MSGANKGSKPGFFNVNSNDAIANIQQPETVHRDVPHPANAFAEKGVIPSHLSESKGEQHLLEQSHSVLPRVLQDEESHLTDEESYPEGGLRAWLCVFGSFCGMTLSFGLMNTIGVFQAYFSENQLSDYSESTIGWISSVFIFIALFCGLQIGPIFDAKGPRWLILSGSILVVAAPLLLGVCTAYWHFLVVFGVLNGIGASLILTPSISAIGHFFLRRRATATGLAATGGAVGGIVFPLMLQALFREVGFAWTTRIFALVILILCIAANLLIHSRLPPRQDSSVLPDLRMFRDPAFALATAGTFFLEWGLFVPVAYLPSFMLGFEALPHTLAYELIAILNGASFFGRWLPGVLADRSGRFNTQTLMLSLCGVTTLALWLPASLLPTAPDAGAAGKIKAVMLVYAVVFGFASGSGISLIPVCVGQLCHTSQYGRYYATCYTVVSFGTLTGIPIAGALISAAGGGYHGVVLFTGACYFVAAGCFAWAKGVKVGWRVGIVF